MKPPPRQTTVRRLHRAIRPEIAWVIPVSSATDTASLLGRLQTLSPARADVLAFDHETVDPPAGPDVIATQTAADHLVVIHPDVGVEPRVVSAAIARLRAGTNSMLRCAYDVAGAVYTVPADLDAIEDTVGCGIPLFAVLRRSAAADGTAWNELRSWPVDNFVSATVDVSPVRPVNGGPGTVAELAQRAVRRRRSIAARIRQAASSATGGTAPAAESGSADVAYIGLAGHDNLGDDAMLAAVAHLMPWANLLVNPADAQAVVLGGGTLINADQYYLNRLRRIDAPVLPAVVFGTGVRNPSFWGVTEPLERWDPFLQRAVTVGVRGPHSEEALRSLGFTGAIEIIGDPALSLRCPDVARIEGHVVVAPLHTKGSLHGGDDGVVLEALTTLVSALRSRGHPVTLLASHPHDDRWIIEMMRSVGDIEIGYLAGYSDIDRTLETLASAELVVGERLHASVLAAAVGTPFLAIEYRPKVLDFAASVGQDAVVVRTDQMDRLGDVFAATWSNRSEHGNAIAEHVARYRTRHHDVARRFAAAVAAAAE